MEKNRSLSFSGIRSFGSPWMVMYLWERWWLGIIGIGINMNRKFIIKAICLVLCLFIALNAVTQLLTMSNTAANIAGIVLFIIAIWIGVEVIIKFIKAKENEK